MALALLALLLFSCNKNRFDFDHLESIEGSGQWKVPVGSMRTTLGSVLDQLVESDLISYDDDGNIQICYEFEIEKVLKGTAFLNLGNLDFTTHVKATNPYSGVVLPAPIDTIFCFSQSMRISTDSAGIEVAIMNSGEMLMSMETNLGNVTEIVLSSSDIIMPGGDSLVRHFNQVTGNVVDLSGASFTLRDDNGVADSTLVLNYVVHYQLSGSDLPEHDVTTHVSLNRLKIKQISGYIDSFVYEFTYDTTFNLPLGNVQGQLKLVGAKVEIDERNTFDNLQAKLQVNQAEFYGGGAVPAPIFNYYPFEINVVSTPTYTNVMPVETIDLEFDTKFDAFRLSAVLQLNPDGTDRLISIYDTSALDLKVNAVVPMRFNVPGISYVDTLDLELSDIVTPDLIKEVVLSIVFDSEFPFNLDGQLYMFNSQTGRVTDSIMIKPLHVDGSFSGEPVYSSAEISLTDSRMTHFMEADKLIMHVGVDTDNNDVLLNLDNSLGMTVKADVIYDGEINIKQ